MEPHLRSQLFLFLNSGSSAKQIGNLASLGTANTYGTLTRIGTFIRLSVDGRYRVDGSPTSRIADEILK